MTFSDIQIGSNFIDNGFTLRKDNKHTATVVDTPPKFYDTISHRILLDSFNNGTVVYYDQTDKIIEQNWKLKKVQKSLELA